MTSRPPLAVSQRQPQRSHSGSGLSQRPAHQRTLSQQYLPPSPVRNDLAPEAGDVVQGRYGSNPRRVGSKLKLELANDGITHAGFSESPLNLDPLSANRVFTPSRIMPLQEASELGDMSPHTSQCHTADNESIPLPMPPRRARFVVPIPRPQTTPAPAPVKKDTRPKPFVLETPTAAPRYSNMGKQEPSGYADYYPWNGDHPEDRFSENIIRNGYFDRAPPQLQTEMASAKAPLFPSLKHKSGLHTLSTLFTGILNQRRHSGQITSTSTFKPPPRVTLTDTKREVWLKDLANPAISLRRLSRTIPHGIRGKVLLEQSLKKNVPTDRAVWLAKCVGANEIRAFKRKGVNNTFVIGGEAKWIREWTACVEQFVDTVVSAFGENEWKAKVTYAIRLATHLYAEHLLDRDHYMDWLVSGLENSNQARLPMWILTIRIYWRDLLRSRRTGRRLVTAILGHHTAICQHPDRDILLPLSTQLSSLLESLLLNSPESFVHSFTWAKFRDALLSSLPSDDQAQRHAFESIDKRNERLTRTHIKSQPAVRGILVKLLDTTLRTPFKDDLASQLWKVSEHKHSLIRTVLEWSISPYRPGIAKVYVTASILRFFSVQGADITGAVLDFLDTDPLRETDRKHLVYHLVSELVRTDDFSVPRYLQWLIARGGLANAVETSPDGPCPTRLLVEVPIHALSESIRSLRATILRRSSFSVEYEAEDMATAIRCIKYALSVPLELDDPLLLKKPMSISKLAHRIERSSRALQTEVGSWLYNGYIGGIVRSLSSEKSGVDDSNIEFDSVRALLEAAQDYTMLENVLKALAVSSNAELLASCADTVNLHIQVFAATGSAKSLFQTLLERLKAIREQQGIGARPLLASLASLAPRICGLEEVATQLQKDLIRTDRTSAVDASSPLSDTMATQLQDDETELHEQIEKLASYTSADRPTMERLFQAITFHRLQTCWGKPDERQRAYCILLTRLRVFDTGYFDTLMRLWVQHIRKLTHRPPVAQIFPLLMSSGCLSLAVLFATASRTPMQTAQGQPNPAMSASIYMQEILQMLMMPLSPTQIMASEDCYRFRIIQEQARLENVREVMPLIRGALAEYSSSRNQITQPLDDEKTRTQFLELLRSLILVDSNAAGQTLSPKSPDPKLANLIESVTTRLLTSRDGGGQKTFEQVLELANEFTLPFCQVKLSLNLAVSESTGPDHTERLQSQLIQLSKAMDNAIDANNIMWTGMLPCLSPEITQHMRNRAEARFLYLIPSLKCAVTSEEVFEKDIHMAENLLAVIDSIIRGALTPKSSQISNAMVDKLVDLWEILATTNDEAVPLKTATLSHWLPLLLSYLTLNASTATATTSKPANDTRARALLTLAGLTQELDHAPSSDLSQRAFDLALVLVDHLADDARLQCVRAVKDVTADPRLRYLFSFAPNPAENLMLAHREKPPPGLGPNERRALALGLGTGMLPERLTPLVMRRWEILNEPTPNVGENDTSLSLHLFEARKI
ncbi:transcription mediator subunit Med12 [Pseudomassariella vexata]|uniref:Mediator of RNA polymerase II transcription subunit 12 n=1 Tax=Pseudomassariella vexata TaxID=1141098 RepID=A0A1Y2E6Y5_9PEZI|nr:transcription mediator subunit Med12 [Pseudomassariella vexata]ORY67302.1 transcription mediator subunit Med12 [Pseudomassariella vexata]